MYTFKATFTHTDEKGFHYERLLIKINLTPYDHEDFDGMDPDCFAFVMAVKEAYKYLEHRNNSFSLDKIEFISC